LTYWFHTVIEVGVDVANATGDVVELPSVSGWATTQLRGRNRPRRGQVLLRSDDRRKISEDVSAASMHGRTTDGFQIAELDLELRGPGEFFGTRQAGMRASRAIYSRPPVAGSGQAGSASVLAGPK